MKKLLTLMLGLSICSLIIIIGAPLFIAPARDHIVINETILEGDKKQAEGIHIGMGVEYDRRHFWDTTFTLTHPFSYETEYKPFSTRINPNDVTPGIIMEYDYDAMKRTLTNGIGAGLGEFETGLWELSLDDYMEYYPLQLDLYLFSNFTQVDEAVNEALTEHLRIPIPQNQTVQCLIDSTQTGELYASNINWSSTQQPLLEVFAVDSEAGFYFLLNQYTMIDQNLNMRTGQNLIRNGFRGAETQTLTLPTQSRGVHYMPYLERGFPQILDHKNLTQIYPLGEEVTNVLAFNAGKRSDHLLLVTQEEDGIWLHVMDGDKPLQKRRLTEEKTFHRLIVEEDYLLAVVGGGELIVLTPDEAGVYDIFLENQLQIQDDKEAYQNMVVTRKQENLAIAYGLHGENSIHLLICNPQGTVLSAEYDHSGDIDKLQKPDGLSIKWD